MDTQEAYRILRRATIQALAVDGITLTPQRFDERAKSLVERRGVEPSGAEYVWAANTLHYAVTGISRLLKEMPPRG